MHTSDSIIVRLRNNNSSDHAHSYQMCFSSLTTAVTQFHSTQQTLHRNRLSSRETHFGQCRPPHITAPKAGQSRRQKRQVRSGMGGVSPRQPTRGTGEHCELLSGVWGRAPTRNAERSFMQLYADALSSSNSR